MRQPEGSHRGGDRRILGIAVTAVAWQATIACTYDPMQTEVSLPVQTVTLNQSNPLQTSRFRIETTYDSTGIVASLSMADAVVPVVTLTPVEGGSGSVTNSLVKTRENDPRKMTQVIYFNLECPSNVSCSVDFETTCTAQNLGALDVTGTLEVKARVAGNNESGENYYLSIEPL